jgi:hypothetical protein
MSKYALLGTKKQNAACEKEISKVLNDAASKLSDLAKKYPECGIGDTATDEEIAGEFYGCIHC